MIQCSNRDFHIKRWLIILLAVTLSATFMWPSSNTPSYALTSFGEDCSSCHQSGITVSTNATGAVQVEINDSFWLEVSASGGTPRDTELVWSNVSHNTYFSFTPDMVKDNGPKDGDSIGGEIMALFEISTPNVEGNYFIRTYAASSQGKGGFVEVEIVVGAGGEIPRAPLEVIMELITAMVPFAFGGIAMLGIAIYAVGWNKIPKGEN